MANLKFALHYFDCIILMSFDLSETAIGIKKGLTKTIPTEVLKTITDI